MALYTEWHVAGLRQEIRRWRELALYAITALAATVVVLVWHVMR